MSGLEAAIGVAALGAAFGTIVNKLADAGIKEVLSDYGLDEDIEELTMHHNLINAVLKDAEQQRHSITETKKTWLSLLEAAALSLRDALDDLHPAMSNKNKRSMKPKVEKLIKKLNRIASQGLNFGAIQEGDHHQRARRYDYETDETNIEHVLGRQNEKDRLMKFPYIPNQNGDVAFFVLLGIGGIGKTTLANWIYNQFSTDGQPFTERMWACLSQASTRVEAVIAILESKDPQEWKNKSKQLLVTRLKEILRNKVYLLVLDDVWIENKKEWDALKTLLFEGSRGSKVVVTTRSKTVAINLRSRGAEICYLEELEEHDCQSLFFGLAMPNEDEAAHQTLQLIGEDIVRRCKGVPLVVDALGTYLSDKRDDSYWLSLRDKALWKMEGDLHILSQLRSSYNHLSPNLKRCFEFCSLYPQNYEFKKDVLIKLWIAHDYVQVKEGKLLEDIGEDYFDQLGREFSVQSFDRNNVLQDPSSKIPSFNLHELFHELAIDVASSSFTLMVPGESGQDITRGTHHLSLLSEGQAQLDPKSFRQATNLRTLILLNHKGTWSINAPREIFQFASIRILDLSNANLKKLSKRVSQLKHLRYLDLSKTNIDKLPETFSSLLTLQTLKLLNCPRLGRLPSKLPPKMTNLRHLEVDCFEKISSMPRLITLHQKNSLFTLCVEGMPMLRKWSSNGQLQQVKNLKAIQCPNLTSLPQFPSLEKLQLLRCNERILNLVVGGSMIRDLRIGGFSQTSSLPNAIFLNKAQLSRLEISDCPKLESLDFSGLTSLKDLRITCCSKLASLPRSIENSSMLRVVALKNLPLLKVVDVLVNITSLRELILETCHGISSMPQSLHKKSKIVDCPELEASLKKGVIWKRIGIYFK